MKLKIAARTFNCEYFIANFLEYYLNVDIDKIYIFDSDSDDKTKNIIKKYQNDNNNIHLVLSSKELRHFNEVKERRSCNLLFEFALNDFKEKNAETWWLFLDIDEFIQPPEHMGLKTWLEQRKADMIRTIFIDWYLPPELANTPVKAREMIQLAKDGKIKGKIAELWGDPFFKDNIIRFNDRTIEKYKKLKAGGGFHRWNLKNQLYLPPNKEFLVTNHLQGIPKKIMQKKLEGNLKLLVNTSDEWLKVHFQKVKGIFDNYDTFYDTAVLKTIMELNEIIKTISNYKNEDSYFNNVIMKEYLENLDGSKPSDHGIDGFDK